MADSPIVWGVPERDGGIATYSRALYPAVRDAAARRGLAMIPEPLQPVGPRELAAAVERLAALSPRVIHVQHEYAFFGRKELPFNTFPAWVREVRRACPGARLVITSHTVIPRDFRYVPRGSILARTVRGGLNRFALPLLRHGWHSRTYAGLDAVVVHSGLQKVELENSTAVEVTAIPHFVLKAETQGRALSVPLPDDLPLVVVFGYIGWEKAQDVAVDAWVRLRGRARLVIAGGTRRREDEAFAADVRARIHRYGLEDWVLETGYVPENELNALYARAAIVLAPFRMTSGSGSITHAFARGAPVLASDLPLNRELNDRVPGTVELFRSESPESLADAILRLLDNQGARRRLAGAGREYAERFSPEAIADAHVALYERIAR
jgi:glycosyltransferase involved in cell wall biosynthesis